MRKSIRHIWSGAVLGCGAVQGHAAAVPPNIIFVMADDISAKDLAVYNPDNPHGIRLPFVERMAKEGVMFQTAWSAPMCGPSRAMLQTGKYPFKTGYFENQVEPEVPFYRNPRHRILGPVMKQAGYVNGWFGKVHHGGNPEEYGFDEYCITRRWEGHNGPHQFQIRPDSDEHMYAVSWYWHPGLVANGKGIPTTPADFGPEIEMRQMLEFISRHKKKPFFIYWPSNLPHMEHCPDVPMNQPGSWYFADVPDLDAAGNPTGGKVEGSLASNMQYLDAKLKQIAAHLEAEGLLENTLIFLTGDNGTPGYGKSRFESEVALRVPFIVWGPGRVKPRGASPVLIDFTDIFPTLAELAGGEAPGDLCGHSFAPYLTGQPFTPRDWIFMQFNNARWLRDRRWLLDGNGRFYDCGDGRDETAGWGALEPLKPLGSAGPKDPDAGYRDVSETLDSGVVDTRKQVEKILEKLPGPDYNDPETKAAWGKFRKRINVYRPSYLD